jgi:hypothetical protein
MFKFTPKKIRQFFYLTGKKISADETDFILKNKKSQVKLSKFSKKHYQKFLKYRIFFYFVPGLKAVFMANNTAFGGADNNSDIDLFVVSQNNSLWITRVFLTIFLHILGVRRHKNFIKHRFCLSFFATEKGAFSLEDIQIKKNKDPYLAMFTVFSQVLIAEKEFYENFIKNNQWVKNYQLNFVKYWEAKYLSKFNKISGNLLSFLGLNKLLKKIFLNRALKKAKKLNNSQGIIINDKFLKFHNTDKRQFFLENL